MFCRNCGKPNDDNAIFCTGCGAKFDSQAVNVNTAVNMSQTVSNMQAQKPMDKAGIMKIVTMIIAGLGIIIPFLPWADIPLATNTVSYFGTQYASAVQKATSYSPFTLIGYGALGNSYAKSGGITAFLIVLILLLIVPMVFYVIYIILTLMKKERVLKFLLIGSIVMLVATILFMLMISAMSSITFSVINMTFIPWLNLMFTIANIVLLIIINTNRKQAMVANQYNHY